jgi:hypothetical protein
MTRYLAGKDHGDVFLDGCECHDVVECDDELGFVIRCKRNDAGRLVLNEARDTIIREVVLGRVVVVRTVTPTLKQARGSK